MSKMQKKTQDDTVLFIPGTILTFQSWRNLGTLYSLNVHPLHSSIKSFSDWELLNTYAEFTDFMLIRVKSNTGGLLGWTKWMVVMSWWRAQDRPVVALSLSLAGHVVGSWMPCDSHTLGVQSVHEFGLGFVHFVVLFFLAQQRFFARLCP